MHPDRLTRQAIRLAQRESLKRGHPLSRDEILKLKIQTGIPAVRIVLVIFGLLCALSSYLVVHNGIPWYILAITVTCSAVFLWAGILGSRQYIEKEMKKLGQELPTRILDSIINAL